MNQNIGTSKRIIALDVFRGITVAAMILVNNPGDWGAIYSPLKHAEWHGVTPTDLIFPFFLFIMGASIVYGFANNKDIDKTSLIGKIIKRSLILFFLGLFLNLFPDFNFSTVRIMGVLQRIAIVYFVCSLLFLYTRKKFQLLVFIIILLGYYLVMNFITVPDFGMPNLAKETNLAAWVDRTLLTENHTWKFSKTWDPEGVLSTFPAICSGLSGMFLATIFLNRKLELIDKFKILIISSFIAIALSIVLHPIFPINKSLWTSTYVLFTGGCATTLYILIFYLTDVKKYNLLTSLFLVYGMNAITVFFGSTIIAKLCSIKFIHFNNTMYSLKEWIYKFYIASNFQSAKLSSMLGALIFVAIWFLILKILFRYKIFIKV